MLALLLPASAWADETLSPTELLDRLTGDWVMTGMVDGEQVVHEVTGEWILEDGYLMLHELSRQQDATGRPAYEAVVIISWEEVNGEFKCLWLDTTANTGLDDPVIGIATPAGHDIAFVWTGEENRFHNTFSCDDGEGTWRWVLRSERDGEFALFADVTLKRP
jgi:hypothetical protein